ncbi:MAG: hypothetical protein ACRDMZ_05385 [Solirubrobacteraceae bacterium]
MPPWSESPAADTIVPIARLLVFLPAFPSLAVDRDGRAYAAFHSATLGDPDCGCGRSRPGRRAGVAESASPTRPRATAARSGGRDVLGYGALALAFAGLALLTRTLARASFLRGPRKEGEQDVR